MNEQNYTDREEQKRNLRRSMLENSRDAQEQEKEYEQNLKRHRKKRRWIVFAIVLAVLAAAGTGAFLYLHRSYDHMEILWSRTVEDGSMEGAVRFGDGLVKYGRDAASYIDADGTVQWTESYEMSHPTAVVNGDYLVLADQGANRLIICSVQGKQGDVTTASPITRAAVAKQGMTVVILEDKSANYLAFYDRSGKKLEIEIKTKLQGDGYPLDLAVSPSGEQLMVSYVYVSDGSLRSKIVFYNFDVGQDMVDRIVGGFEQYEDTMIPRVAFLGESRAVAFGNNRISFYSLKNQLKPSLLQEITVQAEIQAVFWSDRYAGVVTRTESSEMPYLLTAYDTEGETVLEKEISSHFTKIEFVDEEILLYNKDTLSVCEMSGKEKYRETLSAEISAVVPGSRKDRYILIGNGLMQAVELR